jgi:dethiobiotin synthetase
LNKGYFVTGTDTGVGKTAVTAGLLAGIRARGIDAVGMKPIQSGGVMVDGRLISEDARFCLSLSNLSLDLSDINCYCFKPSVSPHLAAEMSGEKIELEVIRKAFDRLSGQFQLVLVEGAGGLCVPLIGTEFTVADLAIHLDLPLIIVARAGLGTINHTVLTIKWAQHLGLTVKGIIVNGCSATGPNRLEENNVNSIIRMTDVPVLGIIPQIPGLNVEDNQPMNLLETMNVSIDWSAIVEQGAEV